MKLVDSSIPRAFATTQHWSWYSSKEHWVWEKLYRRRIAELESTASRVFLEGIDLLGLESGQVPNLADVNARLQRLTGWQAVPVTGFIPAHEFFKCLAERQFPTTVTVRSLEQLEYVEAPDIFHDVFGHVPMHAHAVFADFLQRFGALAAQAMSPADTVRMARLFWFTVEFGLIREAGDIKLYGSGLLSSSADGRNALSDACERRTFELHAVMRQPFEIDHLQNVLYVIESFDELFEAVTAL